jgi:hypothetical protein
MSGFLLMAIFNPGNVKIWTPKSMISSNDWDISDDWNSDFIFLGKNFGDFVRNILKKE